MITRRFIHSNPTRPAIKEVYNFNAGINTLFTNEQLKDGVSPYLRNTRYALRGTVHTRKGPSFYSVPIDQALDFQQIATAGAADRSLSTTVRLAAKIVPTVSNNLTRLDLNLKTGTGAGVIRVDVYSDSSGPGTLLAETSITSVSAAYGYVIARFLNPPALVSGSTYWVVAYIQEDGSGAFSWSSTTGATAMISTGFGAWTAAGYALNIKTYLTPPNPTLGGIRFYRSTGAKVTLIANKKGVYTVDDVTGAVTQIFAGNNSATTYRFAVANDLCFFVNEYDAPQQFNGTVVQAVPGNPPISSDVTVHKNRAFFLATSGGKVRWVFSEAGDFTQYLAVNFFYVPTPFSPDPCQRADPLQDNLVIYTRNTKYVLYGSDLASFTLRRSTGLQGTTSADSVISRDNYEYFVADNGVYSFNGATDTIISNNPNSPSNIQPDFAAILDPTKMSSVVSGNYLRVFFPSPGSSYNNMAFIYDLVFGIWFIDDNTPFSKGFTMKGSGDVETLILGSSIVGAVYYADTNDSDMGAPITLDYRTQYETYDQPAAKKQLKRFYPEFTGQQGNYTCSVYVDFDFSNAPALISNVNLLRSGPVWGAFTWGSTTWGAFGNIKPRLNVPGFFSARQYRFIHKGVNNPVELIGFSDYFFTKRAR
jgi:hypothetical protein